MKLDINDAKTVEEIVIGAYNARRERLLPDGRSARRAEIRLTWEEYKEEEPDSASAFYDLVFDLLRFVMKTGYDIVKSGSWIPRQTIVLQEPFSSEEPIHGMKFGPTQRSRRRAP